MTTKELEQLCKSADTLDAVLIELKDYLEMIDKWTDISLSEIGDNPVTLGNAMNQLSIAYKHIDIAYELVDSEYRTQKDNFCTDKMIECENADTKYVATKVEKEASVFVKEYRRVRAWLKGYADTCNKRILVLQSVKRGLEKVYNSHPSTEE